MTEVQVRPPIHRINLKEYPLTWMSKEFHLYKQINMLDSALFFDTSIDALALDETSYLIPYQNRMLPQFKHHEKEYVTLMRHLPQKNHVDDGKEIQGEFGDKNSWPKLKWSNFDMYVYKAPPTDQDHVNTEDLVRKITVEQSHSGKSRRVILQGRNTADGPWISATIQFDLDTSEGFEPKAKLQAVAINWTDEKSTEWGLTFKPKFNEKDSDFWIDHVAMHRRLLSSQSDNFEVKELTEDQINQIVSTAHNDKTGAFSLEIGNVNVKLPIPLALLKKVKFPNLPPSKSPTATTPLPQET